MGGQAVRRCAGGKRGSAWEGEGTELRWMWVEGIESHTRPCP